MNKGVLIFLCLICLVSFVSAEIISDVDMDGIPSNIDNCPLDYNPLQEDMNHNGIGDICDPNAAVIIENKSISNQTSTSKKGRAHTTIEQFCEPNWQCSAWSQCDDEIMTRSCRDTNNCDFSYNKPAETTVCEQKALIKADNTNYTLLLSLGITTLLLIILVVLLLKRR